ncbi:MAG: tetratricopeptide repeat protein [Fimbriimonadaceae bacterium]
MRALGALLTLSLLQLGWTVPSVLIVQDRLSPVGGTDRNVMLDQALAESIDRDGRLAPIVWSLSDPVFRDAVDRGRLREAPDQPNFDQAARAMGPLGAEYLLVVTAELIGNSVEAEAKLFRGRRQIWTDKQQFAAFTGGRIDLPNTSRSLAATWVRLMGEGPLRSLTPRPKPPAPALDPGSSPVVPDPDVAPSVRPPLAPDPEPPPSPAGSGSPPRSEATAALLAEAMRLMGARQFHQAIFLLRDGVDQAPLDPERRRALILALLRSGDPESSAGEARRASELFPNRVEFRVLAARAWLAAGNPDEASADLNEALVRDPEAAETRFLMGEMQLLRLRVPLALEHLNASLERLPTADAYHRLAIAHAVLGDFPAMEANLTSADRAASEDRDPSADVERHRFLARMTDSAAATLATQIRDWITRIRPRPRDPVLAAERDDFDKVLVGLVRFSERVAVPTAHQESHRTYLLALKLLRQTLSDAGGSLGVLDEDALMEASISLGEAIRTLEAARSAFARETARN